MREFWDRLPPAVRGTVRTIVTVALNGGAASLMAVTIDPDHFGRAELRHVAIVFGIGALAGVVNWIRQAPWRRTPEKPADLSSYASFR